MSLLRFLGITDAPAGRGEDTALVKIAAELADLEPERARFFASFAYVLARVAGADLRFGDEELTAIKDTLVRCAGIDQEEAQIVTRIAEAQVEELGGTHNYIVTREFSRLATTEERFQLLDCLYAIAAADDRITGEENSEIITIAHEIGLSRQDALAARSRFRDKIAELKRLPGESQG